MSYHHLWLGISLVCLLIAGARCIRDVKLEVIPRAVERGREALLRCHYDLEGETLYSVKWYRGTHEFYRFSPTDESAPTKIFEIPRLSVNREKSNASQVTISNVDFALSGTFGCEVTADAPTYATALVSANLTVVSLPKSKPVIVAERERYDPGDVLRANCSLPASKPPAHFSFTLNNLPVGQESITKQEHQKQKHHAQQQLQQQQVHYHDGLTSNDTGIQWSELALTLQPFHYANGQLNLRCIAEIYGVYLANAEVHLTSGLREPVPERVTSQNIASRMTAHVLVLLATLHLFVR